MPRNLLLKQAARQKHPSKRQETRVVKSRATWLRFWTSCVPWMQHKDEEVFLMISNPLQLPQFGTAASTSLFSIKEALRRMSYQYKSSIQDVDTKSQFSISTCATLASQDIALDLRQIPCLPLLQPDKETTDKAEYSAAIRRLSRQLQELEKVTMEVLGIEADYRCQLRRAQSRSKRYSLSSFERRTTKYLSMLPTQVKESGDLARKRRKRGSQLESIVEVPSSQSISAATTIEEALQCLNTLVERQQPPILTSPSQVSETPCPPRELCLRRRRIARQRFRRHVYFSPVKPLRIKKARPDSIATNVKQNRRKAVILSRESLSPVDANDLRLLSDL